MTDAEKAKLREALERIVRFALDNDKGTVGEGEQIAEDEAALRAHLDSLPESEPGEAEAALETLRDVIALFTRHEGRSEDEAVHRSHMKAWYTVRAALRAASGPDAEATLDTDLSTLWMFANRSADLKGGDRNDLDRRYKRLRAALRGDREVRAEFAERVKAMVVQSIDGRADADALQALRAYQIAAIDALLREEDKP